MFETDADRLEYLTTFGEGITFISGQDDWTAYGIQDNEFIDVNGVESRNPVLMVRYIDMFIPGETMGIGNRATSVLTDKGGYNIVEVQDDGTGMVLVVLELQ